MKALNTLNKKSPVELGRQTGRLGWTSGLFLVLDALIIVILQNRVNQGGAAW